MENRARRVVETASIDQLEYRRSRNQHWAAAEEEKAVVEVEEAREDEQGCREIAVIDEDEDEVNWSLSTEELNKKCDEFIRRMKDEIKSESQQHLVMVR
ncbi:TRANSMEMBRANE PROTEIN [Salix koriyanagi]|uniref:TRANSMEMBRANE PROTEIN n=1 Tax=Salix koriyanagi TaxID=2511006 RepID=A0A9Q0U5J0_9ROSI|nr:TRANSMEMBRANE PROTEIN [Salix koriyanagi]